MQPHLRPHPQQHHHGPAVPVFVWPLPVQRARQGPRLASEPGPGCCACWDPAPRRNYAARVPQLAHRAVSWQLVVSPNVVRCRRGSRAAAAAVSRRRQHRRRHCCCCACHVVTQTQRLVVLLSSTAATSSAGATCCASCAAATKSTQVHRRGEGAGLGVLGGAL